MIRSRLHRCLELMEDCGLRVDLRTDPMFIFDREIVSLLVEGDSATRSFRALKEADLCHLPYERMTLQFDSMDDDASTTWFASLRETAEGHFWVRTAAFRHGGGDREYVVVCDRGTHVEALATEFDIRTSGKKWDAYASAAAVKMAVLMTHVQGLDRAVEEAPERLNRHRLASGREPVRSYTYVHVARVTDRDGVTHERGAGGSGRHMPIHMRAGHTRRQHHGPGREQTKLVWIPPVMVNYRPDASEPVLERRIVR